MRHPVLDRATPLALAVCTALLLSACGHGDGGNNSSGADSAAASGNNNDGGMNDQAINADLSDNEMDINYAQADTANSADAAAPSGTTGGAKPRP